MCRLFSQCASSGLSVKMMSVSAPGLSIAALIIFVRGSYKMILKELDYKVPRLASLACWTNLLMLLRLSLIALASSFCLIFYVFSLLLSP